MPRPHLGFGTGHTSGCLHQARSLQDGPARGSVQLLTKCCSSRIFSDGPWTRRAPRLHTRRCAGVFVFNVYHARHKDYQPGFFITTSNSGPKITGTLRKTPEFRKMAIMISWSELILVFFGVEQRIGGYERLEKVRRLRCGVLSCAVLSCAVYIFILHLLFEGCDLPQCFFLLHVAISSTSFTDTDTDT